jgi:hypothetical protein
MRLSLSGQAGERERRRGLCYGAFPVTYLLLLGLLAPDAFAGGYNLPDPPNTVTFDKVQLRSVPVPKGQVPANCDPKYRAAMEGSFRRVWEQCQAIGNDEPSDCQRGLFDRCVKLAQELQAMESSACVEMLGERDALDRIRNPDTQVKSQVSSADLNRRAAAATKKVAGILERQVQELSRRRLGGAQALKAAACSLSTSAKDYGKTEGRLLAEVANAEKLVKAEANARRAAATEFEKNAAKAGGNAADLKSLAAAGALPVATSTSVETVAVSSAPATTVISSTTTTTLTNQASNPYVLPSSSEKKINWVPILAVGIPAAAILGALAFSKRSKGGGDSADAGPSAPPSPSSGAGGDPGPSGPAGNDPAPEAPPRRQGTPAEDASSSPAPGGDDLRSLNMTLDSSFTDREKAIISYAVQTVPACYRGKLRNLNIQSANLGGRGRSSCVAGVYRLGGNLVKLDPGCAGIQVGITLHELFHVLGNRNGNSVHRAYLAKVYQPNPGCPVSRYGATHWMEDFAEAGRLTLFARGGQKNPGACVDKKLDGVRALLASCQQ